MKSSNVAPAPRSTPSPHFTPNQGFPIEIVPLLAGRAVGLAQLQAMACVCTGWKSATEPMIAKIGAGFLSALEDGAAIAPFSPGVSLKLAVFWLQSHLQNHLPQLGPDDRTRLARAFTNQWSKLRQEDFPLELSKRVSVNPEWIYTICQTLLQREDAGKDTSHILSFLEAPAKLMGWLETRSEIEVDVWRIIFLKLLTSKETDGNTPRPSVVFLYPLTHSEDAAKGLQTFFEAIGNFATVFAAEKGKPLFIALVACALTLKAQGVQAAADFLQTLAQCQEIKAEDIAAIAKRYARNGSF